jgi:hypothetical protein
MFQGSALTLFMLTHLHIIYTYTASYNDLTQTTDCTRHLMHFKCTSNSKITYSLPCCDTINFRTPYSASVVTNFDFTGDLNTQMVT